jgi:hypothetical protein
MVAAWVEWKDTVDDAATEGGTSAENMAEDFTDAADEVSDAGSDLADDIDGKCDIEDMLRLMDMRGEMDRIARWIGEV